ncbi:hypothetical protein [Cupriavidus pampae]|uniref:Uncharacterized protein n=1 Tax=Cupriavidus pampae TaxID=659251 RepID=A0ABN7ZD95_9BURK|nr:hypothetical protein [Cupriavidus pampae]CAG9183939.1 hypothetical protein LMG32289_05467 [Cupriavidus pampae]
MSFMHRFVLAALYLAVLVIVGLFIALGFHFYHLQQDGEAHKAAPSAVANTAAKSQPATLDAASLCFEDGKPFSVGAVAHGRECRAVAGRPTWVSVSATGPSGR